MPPFTNGLPCFDRSNSLNARARLLSAATAIAAAALIASALASPALAADRISVAPGPNGTVSAISDPDSNGTRYLGGTFTAFDSWGTGGGALVGATTGAVDASFSKVTGTVLTSTPDGAGGFYIGGTFTSVGGTTRNNAAHINADGSLDASWNPNLNGTVYALAVSGSAVYLGGDFTTVGGTTRKRAAAVGTDGTLTSWNPYAGGTVQALAVSGSTVYLGGNFTSVGGAPGSTIPTITTRNRAAAVGTDGSLKSWNPNLNSQVSAFAVLDSTVYLGGQFTSVGGTPRNYAAAVGAVDGILTSWNPNLNCYMYCVNAIAVSGSTVYLGGDFTTVGGTPRNRAAAVGTDGTLTSWNPNLNSSVFALTVSSSTVYLGGNFTSVGSATRNYAATVGTDGTLTSWNPNVGGAPSWMGGVSAFAVSGSAVYLGGNFTTVGGTPRNSAAAVGAGGALTSWNPNVNGAVSAVAVLGSTVYLGGGFTTVDNTARNYAAAVGTDGALTSWNPNLSSWVLTLAVSGSTIYLGGDFTTVGVSTRNRAAAVGTDGTLTSWNPNLNSQVSAFAILGSTVYLGGQFSAVGVTPRNYAAAVGTDGTLTSWNPNLNSAVRALAILGSTVYLGGQFTTAGGTPRTGAAAVGTDGTLTSWNPNLNSTLFALAATGSTVYLGGAFTTMGVVTRSRAAAVGTDGTLLPQWPGPLPAAAPTALVATPGDASASIAFTPGADNGAAITNYEYSTNNGSTWSTPSPSVTTSPIAISGLSNGTSYQVKLRAINSAGAGTESTAVSVTPAAAPAAPTALVATPGNASASIAFTPGADNGAAISSYEYSVNNGSTWATVFATSSPIAILGLNNGASYQVKLRAINTAGTGAESTSVSVTPAAAPAAPTAVVATGGDASASIAFTAGADNGAAITNYEYSVDNGSTWTTPSPSAATSPVAISGLNNGTSYRVKLRAINTAGTGAESDAVSVTPAAAPAAPTALVATGGDASASIAFTPGADNGAAITNYEYSTNNGSTWTTPSPSATTSPIAISGLNNGTAYSVKLRAINTAGTGAESDAVSVTPADPTPTPTPQNKFVTQPSAASNSSLQSSLTVPGPGAATQRASFTSPSGARSSKTVTACSGSKKITKAGRYRIDCKLTSAARSARRHGAIRITLITTFTPTGGTARAVLRKVTLKKTSSGVTG